MNQSPSVELHLIAALAAALDERGVLPMTEFIAMVRLAGSAAAANGQTELAASLRAAADLFPPVGE